MVMSDHNPLTFLQTQKALSPKQVLGPHAGGGGDALGTRGPEAGPVGLQAAPAGMHVLHGGSRPLGFSRVQAPRKTSQGGPCVPSVRRGPCVPRRALRTERSRRSLGTYKHATAAHSPALNLSSSSTRRQQPGVARLRRLLTYHCCCVSPIGTSSVATSCWLMVWDAARFLVLPAAELRHLATFSPPRYRPNPAAAQWLLRPPSAGPCCMRQRTYGQSAAAGCHMQLREAHLQWCSVHRSTGPACVAGQVFCLTCTAAAQPGGVQLVLLRHGLGHYACTGRWAQRWMPCTSTCCSASSAP